MKFCMEIDGTKLNVEKMKRKQKEQVRVQYYNITNVHPEKCILKYAILCMQNDTPKIVICK